MKVRLEMEHLKPLETEIDFSPFDFPTQEIEYPAPVTPESLERPIGGIYVRRFRLVYIEGDVVVYKLVNGSGLQRP
jgi:hypothetical protein